VRRQRVEIGEIAEWNNLQRAVWKAARGKRLRPDVAAFLARADQNTIFLQKQLLDGELDWTQFHCFTIRDPKPRKIVAVDFQLRVVHHAIINRVGWNFERSQLAGSFACLPGRGVHAAVLKVQDGLRRAGHFVQIDIAQYFANISHARLQEKLAQRFKGEDFLLLLGAIIDSYEDAPGKGLPIGSLTSQYFANFFLEKLDRHLSALPAVSGYVRYMDDIVWFCDTKHDAHSSFLQAEHLLAGEGLSIKPNPLRQRTKEGTTFCGYRICPERILLGTRKKRRYIHHLRKWQYLYGMGEVSAVQLQQGYDAVHGSLYPAATLGFRQKVVENLGWVEV
jgi:hypothetical protein